MATPTVLKRSSRLNTRDLPVKVIPGKRLRSRIVTTLNEDSPKTKVSSRTKQLSVINDISPVKYKSAKPRKGSSPVKSSKMKSVTKVKKSLGEKKQEEKKIPKRRKNIISNNVSANEHGISIKGRKVTNNPTKQRQMSLEESFKRQSLPKRLRPRRNQVNYCDDSKLLQHHLPSKHQDSVVVLERVDSDDIKKLPVYKTTKTIEPSLEDKNDIYDFKYDVDDTKEKLTKKKKKKRNIKMKSKKTKRNVHMKVAVEVKTVDNRGKSDSDADLPVETARCKSPLESVAASIPIPPPNLSKEDVIEVSRVDTNVHIVEETSLPDKPSDKPSAEQIEKQDGGFEKAGMQDAKKPRIVSIENADNISIVKAVPGSNQDILPFRPPSNILNNRSLVQYRNTTNSSFLITSLSPISKEYDTFDAGSPWRPPQLLDMFSRSKYFIQSTPNVTKMDTIPKKRLTQIKDGSCNADKVALNASDVTSRNANSSVQNMSDNKVGYRKNPCRKFGTEITNIDYPSNCSMIQASNIEVISEKPAAAEANAITNVPLDTIAHPSPNPPSFDDIDDKENAAANYQTPKKSPKKKPKKRHFPNFSPLKASAGQNENVDPQPGPSGTRVPKSCDEQKVLRQSNLNDFLNLMDMPENSRISMRHGIFGDAHSSPVSAIKKSTKPTIAELKNAFGFCENESEFDSTLTKSVHAIDQVSNKGAICVSSKPLVTPMPARLPLRELRGNLIQKKPNENENHQETTKQKNVVEVSKSPEVKKNNRLVDVVNFSDTFDVLSESERLSSCDVPLFLDLEPSHFTEPPQHSYKRKRVVTFNFSDDDGKEEENEEKNVKKYTKKKKLTKLEKENKKRLDEWVKTVNDTFQEIDEYDLLIENTKIMH
ncbi:PREDICTED: uncharacterized protein LOC106746896 [Dinoponera quadriceps]|uniref:Uncharacterized protein LOC106746896 n=1 Tax=Dinoponera quadriceps TaxID=609295 RepID=A0A6P3XNG6_DINQU|nr:PREDICTED: uncharacterized protein LOC106746896 [Dinoponera quadriceps]XP_014479514.1 PREDICTED: uncharacterized protein LOC106746896 [Dinoponera quadriceps]XP_014479515.1 PREDICTED: uncharacterized protein LOC106746896 [Dinoponera quadriceps]